MGPEMRASYKVRYAREVRTKCTRQIERRHGHQADPVRDTKSKKLQRSRPSQTLAETTNWTARQASVYNTFRTVSSWRLFDYWNGQVGKVRTIGEGKSSNDVFLGPQSQAGLGRPPEGSPDGAPLADGGVVRGGRLGVLRPPGSLERQLRRYLRVVLVASLHRTLQPRQAPRVRQRRRHPVAAPTAGQRQRFCPLQCSRICGSANCR